MFPLSGSRRTTHRSTAQRYEINKKVHVFTVKLIFICTAVLVLKKRHAVSINWGLDVIDIIVLP